MGVSAFAQNKETRNVNTFTGIAFRIPGKLYLKQGSPQKVELEGNKDVLTKIETNVEGNRLEIAQASKWHNFNWGSEDQITVYITVENIHALNVSGSGEVIGQTKIISDALELKVSGSGSLKAEAEVTDEIDANVSGSGKIELTGKCKDINTDVSGSGKVKFDGTIADKASFGISGSGKIEASGTAASVKTSISGSGKVLAANLEVSNCEINLSGSGSVEINVKSSLDAHISGSGHVSYKGNPDHVNSNSSGSGKISKM